MPNDERLNASEAIQIASKLTPADDAFVIGGQAVVLWAWLYRDRDPVLSSEDPVTSSDMDYFGPLKAARSLAYALGGEVRPVTIEDMNTPNTAVVIATINGKQIVIDFLNAVIGVTKRELERGVSILQSFAQIDGKDVAIEIAVLHPVLCLKSRIANMMHPGLMRRDPAAWRQLHAAIAVVRVHIDEVLKNGLWDEAKACFSDLFRYLRSDQYGKASKRELGVDVLDVLKRFQDDERVDQRYREKTLASMVERIEIASSRNHDHT